MSNERAKTPLSKLKRGLYEAHGRLVERMFKRTPPRLSWLEETLLGAVRWALDRIEMRDFNRK
jgi:hypothetical protein